MKSTTRSLILLAAIFAPAVVPADLSAQHRAVPRPPVHHGGYVNARPYYYGYYRPYYGYYRPYYYGPAFGLSVGFGWYGSVRLVRRVRVSLLRLSGRLPLSARLRVSVSRLLGLWRLGADPDSATACRGVHRRPFRGSGGRLRRLGPAPERGARRARAHGVSEGVSVVPGERPVPAWRHAADRTRPAAARRRPAGRPATRPFARRGRRRDRRATTTRRRTFSADRAIRSRHRAAAASPANTAPSPCASSRSTQK